jgi:hypothetical protein
MDKLKLLFFCSLIFFTESAYLSYPYFSYADLERYFIQTYKFINEKSKYFKKNSETISQRGSFSYKNK